MEEIYNGFGWSEELGMFLVFLSGELRGGAASQTEAAEIYERLVRENVGTHS